MIDLYTKFESEFKQVMIDSNSVLIGGARPLPLPRLPYEQEGRLTIVQCISTLIVCLEPCTKTHQLEREREREGNDIVTVKDSTVPLTCSRPVLYGDSNGEAVCRGLKEEVEVLCEGVEVEEEARDCRRDRLIGRKERT